jgi:hypothetical protein
VIRFLWSCGVVELWRRELFSDKSGTTASKSGEVEKSGTGESKKKELHI